jgi:hypothetical protein
MWLDIPELHYYHLNGLRAGRPSVRDSISGKSKKFFSIPKRPDRFRHTQTPIQQSGWGVILIIYLHLVSKSRMSGANHYCRNIISCQPLQFDKIHEHLKQRLSAFS